MLKYHADVNTDFEHVKYINLYEWRVLVCCSAYNSSQCFSSCDTLCWQFLWGPPATM